MFILATLYDVDPMNSLTRENILLVANGENESAFKSQLPVVFLKSLTKFLLNT